MSDESDGNEWNPDDSDYVMSCPFWIDTDSYTDRDRHMFVAGFEFATILRHIEEVDGPLETVIHRENESRVRMACGRFGRKCEIAQHDGQPEDIKMSDGEICETVISTIYDVENPWWSYLKILKR